MTFDEAQRQGVVNMVPHDPPIPLPAPIPKGEWISDLAAELCTYSEYPLGPEAVKRIIRRHAPPTL